MYLTSILSLTQTSFFLPVECLFAAIGYYRSASNKDLTNCTLCEKAETTDTTGSASCSSCDLGKYGLEDRTCLECPDGNYQDKRKQTDCKKCTDGDVANKAKTSCKRPPWKTAKDCIPGVEYLHDVSDDKDSWQCLPCPNGAVCFGYSTTKDLSARSGYWRVPWSDHNTTFERCPYLSDCLGASEADNENATYVEGCDFGTTGPLCSLCIEGYNRDVNQCQVCVNEAVPLRIAMLVAAVVLFLFLLRQCKKKIGRSYRKYRPLWRDVLRVVSINITFAQINSSLPSVIEIEWPQEWTSFVKYFSFVNIDVMSLIGMNCIGDFNYYVSFLVMVCLPLSILVLAIFNYWCSVRVMTHRLATMTVAQKKVKRKHALHALFELADGDHSGHVDPKELAEILHSLGWNINVKTAAALAEKIGSEVNEWGQVLLLEDQFVNAMIGGKIAAVLLEMNIVRSSRFRTKSVSSKNVAQIQYHDRKGLVRSRSVKLTGVDELVNWTLRSSIVSNSLSGATQLLLLAHTPVSRKVFQFFHCQDLGGTHLLRADYDINCKSNEYFAFMPMVLAVMCGYTVALPAVISFYLWRHRKELYTTKTHQRIGWLYDSFVRGAEFWMVHDLLMKMVLTVSKFCVFDFLCLCVDADRSFFVHFVTFLFREC